MLTYAPAPRRKNSLGQIEGFTSGITSGLARQIVSEAEPAVRRIVKEERNRFAEALIGGIPFAVISALSFVGTRYLVPQEAGFAKTIGYLTSAIAAAGGAWLTISRLHEEDEKKPENVVAPSGPSAIDPYIARTAQAIVAEAEPKVKAIVNSERQRIAEASLVALPFGVAAMATFLATLFVVDSENSLVKAAGYAGTTLLLGTGAWFALEKEKELT